jgi:hypothetical protein
VYQLRVVLRGVSPLIWRRLLVRSDSTAADLHRTLQVAFGWSDEHLHRFVIHGRLYGADSLFDSHRVRLGDLGLRLRERFLYEYDFIDGWQHDLRLEQILPPDPQRRYPLCIGGRRAAPPEDCGGPWAFLELRQRYSPVSIASRMLELLSPLLADRHVAGDHVDANDDEDGDQLDDGDDHDRAEELATLLHWVRIDRFDRRAVNRQLVQPEPTRVRVLA